jgi:hypothetical protein
MLNNKDTVLRKLQALNLTNDEARLYLELLREPTTHLKLARATGINRSKVYRLAYELEKRSLVSIRSDDRGNFLVASDPATLEVALVTQEENVKEQRQAFDSVMPFLELIRTNDLSSFIVHTYEGDEGFKQMLWHELKAQDENLMFGSGTLGDLVDNPHWIQQHQSRIVDAGYLIRELINPGEIDDTFKFTEQYHYRIVPRETLSLRNQIAIYNDTTAIYHWRERQKVGIEIVNHDYSQTMRQVFEEYWKNAEVATKPY